MNRDTHRWAIVNLTVILLDYAPTIKAQDTVSRMVERLQANAVLECEDESGGNDFVVKALAGAIFDGLAYGNWPWTEEVAPRCDCGCGGVRGSCFYKQYLTPKESK